DAVCVTGDHRMDWNPHRLRVEPLLQKAKAGATIKATLVLENPTAQVQKLTMRREARHGIAGAEFVLEAAARSNGRAEMTVRVPENLAPGRYPITLSATTSEGNDTFLVIEVVRGSVRSEWAVGYDSNRDRATLSRLES